MNVVNQVISDYNKDPTSHRAIVVLTSRKDGDYTKYRLAACGDSIEETQDLVREAVNGNRQLNLTVGVKPLSPVHWLGWGILLGLIVAKILSVYTNLLG